MRVSRHLASALSIVLFLGGCGDGSSGSAPAPAPAPGPPPTITPTPSPAPTPAPTTSAAPHGEQLASMGVPGQLVATLICSKSPTTVTSGRVTGIASTAGVHVSALMLDVTADYSFKTDVNGFGGSLFTQADYIGGNAFAIYARPTAESVDANELQIPIQSGRSRYFTYGLLGDAGLCFYAATQSGKNNPLSFTTYHGYADGLSQIDGDADRVFGSTVLIAYDTNTKNFQVELDLKSVEAAFDEPAGQTLQSLGKAAAVFNPNDGGALSANLSGPPGYSGTITILTGTFGWGAVFSFELDDSHGNKIWGVAAADADDAFGP